MITSVGWTQRGHHLAVGTNSGAVQIWDHAQCRTAPTASRAQLGRLASCPGRRIMQAISGGKRSGDESRRYQYTEAPWLGRVSWAACGRRTWTP